MTATQSTPTPEALAIIAKHFCIAACWADCEEGTSPRAPKETLETAKDFAARFIAANPELCEKALSCDDYGTHPDAGSPEAAFGHDLYLSCAGHGVGFSDRGELGETGEALGDVIRKNWREWHTEAQFYRGWMYL